MKPSIRGFERQIGPLTFQRHDQHGLTTTKSYWIIEPSHSVFVNSLRGQALMQVTPGVLMSPGSRSTDMAANLQASSAVTGSEKAQKRSNRVSRGSERLKKREEVASPAEGGCKGRTKGALSIVEGVTVRGGREEGKGQKQAARHVEATRGRRQAGRQFWCAEREEERAANDGRSPFKDRLLSDFRRGGSAASHHPVGQGLVR